MNKREICSQCSSVYEVSETKLTFRDNDTFECSVCGLTLASWNASRIPRYRLIEAMPWPAPKTTA